MKKTFRRIVGILIESSIVAGITYHIISGIPKEPISISPVAIFILCLSVAIAIVLEEVMFEIAWVKKVKHG